MHEIFNKVVMFPLKTCKVSLILINFLQSFTLFSKCPVSFLFIPIVKLAKNWVLLEDLAHIERQSVFLIEFLCNYK